jgi:single-strand DNA-binding protein
MNKLTLIGNLTSNPELRSTQSGKSVCVFTIAVDRRFAQDGNKITDFFRINAWGKVGENCGKYLSKGKKVAVIGELQARLYDAKNGEQRLSLDVQADEVEFLSPKDADTATVSHGKVKPDDPMQGFTEINTDDLPF